jgi:hypothetical protein
MATAAEAPTSARGVRNAHGSNTVRSRRFKRSYRTPLTAGVETKLRRERRRAIALVPTRIHFIGGDLAIEVTESPDELHSLLVVTGPRDGPSSITPRPREQDLRQARATGFWRRAAASRKRPASDWG